MQIRSISRTRSLVVGLGLTLIATAVASAPAAAKPGGTAGSTDATASHCVVSLRHGQNTSAPTSCFTTFTAAIRYATNGAVTNAPATPDKNPTLADKLAAARHAPNAAVVQQRIIGIEYEKAEYATASWSIVIVGNAACTGTTEDVDYAWDMPETLGTIRLWDAISSYETFYDDTVCFAAHFWLEHFGAPRTEYTSSRSTMPDMFIGSDFTVSGNDNSRSVQWS